MESFSLPTVESLFQASLEELQNIMQQFENKSTSLQKQITAHREAVSEIQKTLEKGRVKLRNLSRPLEDQESNLAKIEVQIQDLESEFKTHGTLKDTLLQDMTEYFKVFRNFKITDDFQASLSQFKELLDIILQSSHVTASTQQELDTMVALCDRAPTSINGISKYRSFSIEKKKKKLERLKESRAQLAKRMSQNQKIYDRVFEELLPFQEKMKEMASQIIINEKLLEQIVSMRKAVILMLEEGQVEISFRRDYLLESLDFSPHPTTLSRLMNCELDVLDILVKHFGKNAQQFELGIEFLEKCTPENFLFIALNSSSLRLRKFLCEHSQLLTEETLRVLQWNITEEEKEREIKRMLFGEDSDDKVDQTSSENNEELFRGMKMLYVAGGDPGITAQIVDVMIDAGIHVRTCDPSRRGMTLESFDYVLFHMAAADHSSYYYYKGLLKESGKGIFLPLKIRQSSILSFIREKISQRVS